MELKSRRGKKPTNVTLEFRIPFPQEVAADLEERAEKLRNYTTLLRGTQN